MPYKYLSETLVEALVRGISFGLCPLERKIDYEG